MLLPRTLLLLTGLLTSPATVSEREGVEAYSCPVVDGRRVELDPKLTSQSNRPDNSSGETSEDDRYSSDYCTSAPVENIGEEEGGGENGSFLLTG